VTRRMSPQGAGDSKTAMGSRGKMVESSHRAKTCGWQVGGVHWMCRARPWTRNC
jgi:hypothetical protein